MKMVINFLKYIVIIILFSQSKQTIAQALNFSFGPIFTKSKSISAIKNAKEDFSNTDYMFSVSYEHFFKSKFSLITSYSNYEGYTNMLFEKGGYRLNPNTTYILATGFSGVNLKRFDVAVSYNLINRKRPFYLKPVLGLSLQISKKTGVEIYNTLVPLNGPYYFETEPISAESYNTTQIVPSLGLKTGFVFWKRLDINLSVQGVYAAKPYQKTYFDYNYRGTPQPTAVFSSTGTGYFYTLGIGYRFAKFIK